MRALIPIMFIFSTDDDLLKLKNSRPEVLYMDGTRENSPIKGFQVVAIHYMHGTATYTPIIVLVNRFSTDIYKKILEFIGTYMDLKGITLKADFEIPIREAGAALGMKISHCYFHYAKIIGSRSRRLLFKHSIVKKETSQYDHDNRYQSSHAIAKDIEEYLKKLIFVPQHHQAAILKQIESRAENPMERALIMGIRRDFIEGRHSRCFFLSATDPFTNNIAENYFSSYSKKFSLKPSMTKFSEALNDHIIYQRITRLKSNSNKREIYVRSIDNFAAAIQKNRLSLHQVSDIFFSLAGKVEPEAGFPRWSNAVSLNRSRGERRPNAHSVYDTMQSQVIMQTGLTIKEEREKHSQTHHDWRNIVFHNERNAETTSLITRNDGASCCEKQSVSQKSKKKRGKGYE